MKVIHERLKELREGKGYSLRTLAELCNTSKSAVSLYEKGERSPKYEVIQTLARVLDVDEDYLLGKTDTPRKTFISTRIDQSISHNIQFHRANADLSQSQLAMLLGVDESTVADIESGKQHLDKEMLYKICDALQLIPSNIIPTDKEELDEDTEYLLSRRAKEIKLDPKPNAIFLDERMIHLIPVFESVSAGFGAIADDNIADYMPLYFTDPGEAAESICIKVKGDSMYPKIEDGDIIQVHRQDWAGNDMIVVVLLDGEEGLVKRIKYGDNWLELHSINPMYMPMRFIGEDMMRIRVLGVVRKIIKSV